MYLSKARKNIKLLLRDSVLEINKRVEPVFSFAQLEVEILLAEAIAKDRLFLYKNPDYILKAKENRKFKNYLKRRLLGEPIAYIRKYQDFFGHRFKISSDVLIPRPESEELVEQALHLVLFSKPSQLHKNKVDVLDLCCGSGCLGLSLLLARPELRLDLSDISANALRVCRANAKTLLAPSVGTYSYNIYCSDLFMKLPQKKYDLILSNPPYVLLDEFSTLTDAELNAVDRTGNGYKPSLCYEPINALIPPQPKIFYKRLFIGLSRYLKVGGLALIETNPRLVAMCRQLIEEKEILLSLELRMDLNKKTRFLHLTRI